MNSCHCSKCRKAYGAAFGTILVVKSEDFAYTRGQELVKHYQSSERVNRPFCMECGSRLPIAEDWDPLVGIPAGLLNENPQIANEAHIFVADKAPWWGFDDASPRYDTWPPGEDLNERHDDLSSKAHQGGKDKQNEMD